MASGLGFPSSAFGRFLETWVAVDAFIVLSGAVSGGGPPHHTTRTVFRSRKLVTQSRMPRLACDFSPHKTHVCYPPLVLLAVHCRWIVDVVVARCSPRMWVSTG
jgi:hypothetical protein